MVSGRDKVGVSRKNFRNSGDNKGATRYAPPTIPFSLAQDGRLHWSSPAVLRTRDYSMTPPASVPDNSLGRPLLAALLQKPRHGTTDFIRGLCGTSWYPLCTSGNGTAEGGLFLQSIAKPLRLDYWRPAALRTSDLRTARTSQCPCL